MAPLLMSPKADSFHARLLKPLGLEESAEKEVRNLLLTQGLGAYLGFRRTWPTPQRSPARSLDAIADERDVAFARLLNEHKLLLAEMDVLSSNGRAQRTD